jgi:hypothetical protein
MYKTHWLLAAWAAIALTWTATRQVDAQCCHGCGCGSACKTCRLVCEEKEIEVTCWGSKCEDFCVPGPCQQGCRQCATVCGCGDGCESGCGGGKLLVWRVNIPGCPKIFTKKKLMSRTVKQKVCNYTWKIEDLCAKCQDGCEKVTPPAEAFVPPRPDVDAVFLGDMPASGTGHKTARAAAADKKRTS